MKTSRRFYRNPRKIKHYGEKEEHYLSIDTVEKVIKKAVVVRGNENWSKYP